ncbi:MAG: ABC transporter ATP-binding protein [Candidatus Dojkabacteria bacterium]|nr:MAG: ABC transporter ATP-binding protein [Candidatus Dojkabacteria bacterium]
MKRLFQVYLEYLKYTKPYRFFYILSWLGVLALLIAYNITIFVVGDLIDRISVGNQQVLSALLLITLTISLPLIIEPFAFFIKSRLFSSISRDIINAAYKRVITLDHAFHTAKKTGKIASMIITAHSTIFLFVWQAEWLLIESLAGYIIPIILVYVIKPELGIAMMVILLLSMPILLKTLRMNIHRRRKVKDTEYARTDLILDGINNYETIRIFSREADESSHVESSVGKWKFAMDQYENTFRLIDFVTRLIGVITFVVVAVLSNHYFKLGELSLGAFIVVLTYLIQLVGRLLGVVFTMRDILKNLPVAEDLFNLINEKNTVVESTAPVIIKNLKGKVEFKDVMFGYDKRRNILRGLSFLVKPKQNIALVGPSGGGKSTTVKLLMRYYDVKRGGVYIDDVDIRKFPLTYLKKSIGIVPQEPSLFNKSILFNIGYALCSDPERIEDYRDQIIEASKRACVYDFIMSLPQQFDTVVGERGIKLSGGQKQRIAIARVLLKMPKIVIFDEATSMLDSESEQAIKKAFAELSKDTTTIVIAHRLSTIINSDNILVIDGGKVVESGTHEQLIKKKGLYSRLWDIQSGGFQKHIDN